MSTFISVGVANAVCAALLSLLALIVGRYCRRPAVLHSLWLLVLLKLVTPPLWPVTVATLPEEPVAVVEAAPSPVPVEYAVLAQTLPASGGVGRRDAWVRGTGAAGGVCRINKRSWRSRRGWIPSSGQSPFRSCATPPRHGLTCLGGVASHSASARSGGLAALAGRRLADGRGRLAPLGDASRRPLSALAATCPARRCGHPGADQPSRPATGVATLSRGLADSGSVAAAGVGGYRPSANLLPGEAARTPR